MEKLELDKAEQTAQALLRFHRRFRKTLDALDRLHDIGALDPERYRHLRLVLEHSRARVALDAAEWAQKIELANCTRADQRLRRLEAKTDR